MKEEQILKNFSPKQMAGLLVGAQLRTKSDKELIVWLLEEKNRLTEQIKDMAGFK